MISAITRIYDILEYLKIGIVNKGDIRGWVEKLPVDRISYLCDFIDSIKGKLHTQEDVAELIEELKDAREKLAQLN